MFLILISFSVMKIDACLKLHSQCNLFTDAHQHSFRMRRTHLGNLKPSPVQQAILLVVSILFLSFRSFYNYPGFFKIKIYSYFTKSGLFKFSNIFSVTFNFGNSPPFAPFRGISVNYQKRTSSF